MKLKLKPFKLQLNTTNFKQITIVFLAFLAMVSVSYFYVSHIVRQQIEIIGEEVIEATQASLSSNLHEAEPFLTTIAYNIDKMLSGQRSNRDIAEYLEGMYDHYGTEGAMPNVLNTYAYLNGVFFSSSGWKPPKDYFPDQRPWYTGAVECGDGIYISDPYIDADTNGVCISFSQQIFDPDGNSYGVVTTQLKLARIISDITNRDIANNGYGVLLDREMKFIAHSNEALNNVELAQAGGEYGKLNQMLSEGLTVSAERFTDFDGTDSIAFFRPVFNGWYIGVVIPHKSYYNQVYQMGLVLSGLGTFLMLCLSCMLIRIHAARQRSEADSRSKSSFLAKVSHEMRTPMNAIIGVTALAFKTKDINELYKHLDNINYSSYYLLNIINNILDMSKMEAGKMELCETDFQLKDVLDHIIMIMGHRINEKRQIFSVIEGDGVPKSIVTDKQMLSGVITHLLSNANKFTPECGTIQLTIQKTKDTDGGCILQFELEDNGIGIPKELQKPLFSPFEQADNSISRKYGGTGLGLSIAREMVNMMNGDIWVESEPNKGAKFTFTIEAGIGESHIIEHGDITNLFAGKHILLVDDVEINREILIAMLEDTGVTIDCAKNGREACDKFAKNPESYDMIFMDIHMPEMDGYEAARAIRKMDTANAPTIPIIALTADALSESIEKCHIAGMNDHMGKPLAMDILITKMRKHMQPA